MAFVPGQSGNPGGRPKENAEVKALARTHCRTAVEKLAALMESEDEKTRIAACNSILDRGLGKPAQAITGGDEDDSPLKVEGVLKLVKP
jgi:HEAT repeat protein